MEIKQDFIPKGRKNRPAYKMVPKYITIHNTANASKGANAEVHARYVKNLTTVESWHYTVDDGNIIYQHLPTTESGWHAGDGATGAGNRQSIGIEICENQGIDANKANDNAIWLIKRLMVEFNIPIKNVVPHQKWSGKNCPRKILPIWSSFIKKINGEPATQVYTLRNGDKGVLVSQLQTDLNKVGYKVTIDGSFGNATEKVIRVFQSANKLASDGIYGPATQKVLAEAIKLKPTPPVKGEIRMFKPSSETLKNAVIQLLDNATKDKILTSDKWVKQAREGKLSLDDAFALHVEIENRRKGK